MPLRAGRVLLWIAAVVVLFVVLIGAVAWRMTRPERIRASLETQATRALGEPVAIGRLSVAWFPRVALRLEEVRVGSPPRVRAAEVDVSAGLRGLLRRRVDDAELTIRNSQIDVPALVDLMGRLAAPAQGSSDTAGGLPFEIVSVRAIALDRVTLMAGPHTVLASAHGTLEPSQLVVRSLHAEAPGTALDASGAVTLSPVALSLRVEAAHLNVDELMAFVAAATPVSDHSASSGSGSPTPVTLDLTAREAALGGIALSDLSAHATLRGDEIRVDPLRAGVFGGRIEGRALQSAADRGPQLRVAGSLSGAEASRALAWLGQANDTVTGTLSGHVQLAAAGAPTSFDAWHGTARVELSDGVLKGLSIVRQTVVTYAGRAARGSTGGSDRYQRISGTFGLEGALVRCRDLALTSPDLDLRGEGTIRLPGGALDLRVQCLLSPELSAQAGRDLYRYAREGDRIVLPATIGGALGAPSVSIDAAEAAKRALKNKIQEEAGSLLDKLIKRKPKP